MLHLGGSGDDRHEDPRGAQRGKDLLFGGGVPCERLECAAESGVASTLVAGEARIGQGTPREREAPAVERRAGYAGAPAVSGSMSTIAMTGPPPDGP